MSSPCSNKSSTALALNMSYIGHQLLELDYNIKINIAQCGIRLLSD